MAKRAYLAQFTGSVSYSNFTSLWKANNEPKHQLFGWLLLHHKVLATKNLLKRHWPCNEICTLCTKAFSRTPIILLRNIPSRPKCRKWFAKNYRSQQWTQPTLVYQIGGTSQVQWHHVKTEKGVLGALLVTWWNIRLERNMRVFQDQPENKVVFLVIQDVNELPLAFSADTL